MFVCLSYRHKLYGETWITRLLFKKGDWYYLYMLALPISIHFMIYYDIVRWYVNHFTKDLFSYKYFMRLLPFMFHFKNLFCYFLAFSYIFLYLFICSILLLFDINPVRHKVICLKVISLIRHWEKIVYYICNNNFSLS